MVASLAKLKKPLVLQSENDIVLKTFSGNEARRYSQQMASVYINIFKEFPYLYEGSIVECEKDYLERYFISKHSIISLVFNGERIIGASASLPLDAVEEIKSAFLKKQVDTRKFLYIGGTVIEEPFRNLKLIKKISRSHETHARNNGYSQIAFVAVRRDPSHPLRPIGYRPLEPIWQHLGYALIEGIEVRDKWKQIDTHQEEENSLDIWGKSVNKI